MDAVVYMDAMKRPPGTVPTASSGRKRRGISPNAALIAGVGTLLLALGIGVLIGRSGNQTSVNTAAAPQIIKVGGGGEETTAGASTGGAASASNEKPKKQGKATLKKEAKSQKGAEEVLKPKAGVTLPPSQAEVGEKCSDSTAGCSHGEFNGSFFGEE